MTYIPDDIREKIREQLERSNSGPFAYIVGIVLATLFIALLGFIPVLLESYGYDWLYTWFTKSEWNKKEYYAFYGLGSMLILSVIIQIIDGDDESK